jgi:hypothetical protein
METASQRKPKALLEKVHAAWRGERTAKGFHDLIEEGFPVDGCRVPPLIVLAAMSSSLTSVDYLIRRGADVNAKRSDGMTALMACARCGNTDDIERLIAAGADVNARDASGKTALIYALKNEWFDAARVLIQHGANPRIKDSAGVSAFGVIKALEMKEHRRLHREARDNYRFVRELLRKASSEVLS